MESSFLGLVVDSSVLIAAEREQVTPVSLVRSLRSKVGEVTIVLAAISIAEVGHGIYRARTLEIRNRRQEFADELKATIPVIPITAATGEIIARVGGEHAARGINLPLADLIIAATAIELGYAVGTGNLRDFSRIPGLTIVQL